MRATSSTGARTPVDVSTWVTATSFTGAPASVRSSAAEIRHLAERRADLVDVRALALEDRAHAIAEVAGVDHHGALAGIDQVRGRDLHRQRAAARDHERLRAGR